MAIFAVLGLVVAALLAGLSLRLVNQPVGITSEPITAGDRLAPPPATPVTGDADGQDTKWNHQGGSDHEANNDAEDQGHETDGDGEQDGDGEHDGDD